MTCVTNLNAMLNTACKAQVVARMCGNVCEMFEIEHNRMRSWGFGLPGPQA